MKVAIMQPYFFPYLGYISLIKNTDKFILFDPVQFIRHGWIERNRMLKQDGDWQYISVPLMKHSREEIIQDIKINNDTDWKKKIFSQIEHYKKKAPYYQETIEVLKKGLDVQTDSIVKLNQNILNEICNYLGIDADIEIFSEMDMEIEEVNAPDEWALNICKAMGNVSEYWNPIGGLSFFDVDKYYSAGIDIHFLDIELSPYQQGRNATTFIPGLSILDVMMFNSKEEILEMLDHYTFGEDQKNRVLKK